MFTVNRANFIAWTQGIMLGFKKGKGVVGDNTDHEEAERRMINGETIGLTLQGKLVTTMKLTDEGFVETRYQGGNT